MYTYTANLHISMNIHICIYTYNSLAECIKAAITADIDLFLNRQPSKFKLSGNDEIDLYMHKTDGCLQVYLVFSMV